jgi:hypothetical protein
MDIRPLMAVGSRGPPGMRSPCGDHSGLPLRGRKVTHGQILRPTGTQDLRDCITRPGLRTTLRPMHSRPNRAHGLEQSTSTERSAVAPDARRTAMDESGDMNVGFEIHCVKLAGISISVSHQIMVSRSNCAPNIWSRVFSPSPGSRRSPRGRRAARAERLLKHRFLSASGVFLIGRRAAELDAAPMRVRPPKHELLAH